jgi:hypothetical protein
MASSPLHLAAFDLNELRVNSRTLPEAKVLPVGIPTIDEALPDGGLPRGSVVEVCASGGLARATRFALSACASAQREDDQAWCAWVDAGRTLFAPGVAQAGVDLDRLLVVQPPAADVARIAVRLASSHVFSVVVIDRCSVPGALFFEDRSIRWNTAVRRLALATENDDTSILLLSSSQQADREALPTAMRIELRRPALDRLSLRIAKDRRGRLSGPLSIPIIDMTG